MDCRSYIFSSLTVNTYIIVYTKFVRFENLNMRKPLYTVKCKIVPPLNLKQANIKIFIVDLDQILYLSRLRGMERFQILYSPTHTPPSRSVCARQLNPAVAEL